MNHGNLADADPCEDERSKPLGEPTAKVVPGAPKLPFLRIPPFPGSRVSTLTDQACGEVDLQSAAVELRRLRVGGCYWGARPLLPANHVVVRSRGALEDAQTLAGAERLVLWEPSPSGPSVADVRVVNGDCDDWYMLTGAAAL